MKYTLPKKKNELYLIRRDLLADPELDMNILRGALIVLEHIDWNSKEKTFSTRRHLSNWLKSFADTYAIDPDDISTGIDYMIAGEWMRYEERKGQIVLIVTEVKELTPA